MVQMNNMFAMKIRNKSILVLFFNRLSVLYDSILKINRWKVPVYEKNFPYSYSNVTLEKSIVLVFMI